MSLLKAGMLNGADLESDEVLAKHSDWAKEIAQKHNINKDNIDEIIENEIGLVFAKVLEHAGVYKRDESGKKAFLKFIESVE